MIDYCNGIALELGLEDLSFTVGDIADYRCEKKPDIVISLHACDTATDFALDYAVKNGSRAILCVPCCQHELNLQLDANMKKWKKTSSVPADFDSVLKYGIVKERFASLLTDALRCELLERHGYSVQILEFIDMEHTPKNLLIRAVKKSSQNKKGSEPTPGIVRTLELNPTLQNLLEH